MTTKKMATFRYHGPDTTVSFRGGTRVRLLHGRDVELPSDSKYVRDLIARKQLTPVEEKPVEEKSPKSMRPRRKTAQASAEQPAAPVVEENTTDAPSVEKGN